MHLNNKRAKIVKTAIQTWQEENLIDQETAQKLDSSIQVVSFDWKKAAGWAFCFAVFCFLLAFISFIDSDLFDTLVAFLVDNVVVQTILQLFDKNVFRFLLSSLICGLVYYFSFYLYQKNPVRIYRNEAVLFIAVLLNAWAIIELGILFGSDNNHFSLLLLIAALCYGVIGYLGKSTLVWIFALLTFASWLFFETGYLSGWGNYFFGMYYPLRCAVFGSLMTIASLVLRNNKKFEHFFPASLSISLLYLFVSLWLLSMFGNYTEYTYSQITNSQLIFWSILFALAAILAMFLGFKWDIKMLRGYGITFLFINLYTRFFEIFWGRIDKAFFFALLGLSLWLIANKFEKIWLATEKQFGKIIDKE